MKLSNDDCFQFIDTGIIDTFVYRLVQFSFPPHPALLDLGVSLIRPQGLVGKRITAIPLCGTAVIGLPGPL
jgi:hypothetical protein